MASDSPKVIEKSQQQSPVLFSSPVLGLKNKIILSPIILNMRCLNCVIFLAWLYFHRCPQMLKQELRFFQDIPQFLSSKKSLGLSVRKDTFSFHVSEIGGSEGEPIGLPLVVIVNPGDSPSRDEQRGGTCQKKSNINGMAASFNPFQDLSASYKHLSCAIVMLMPDVAMAPDFMLIC